MKHHLEFTYCEDPESGVMGWLMKNAPEGFNATDPLGVAHDTVEHFPGFEELEGELLAFGAMLYVRGHFTNWWASRGARDTNIADIMSYDLARFLAEHGCEVKPLRTIRLPEEDDEDVLYELRNYVRQLLPEALDSSCHENVSKAKQEEALLLMQHWMRRGWRMARRRWDMPAFEIQCQFDHIYDETTRLTKRAEEGNELHITMYTNKRQQPDVKLLTWEDLYDLENG